MTEREKNGERLAMRMSRHRQAKHESLKDEDVKTAYIKGCEDTAQEMTWKYEKQKEINKELVDENESLKKSLHELEKAKALLTKWVELFKPKIGDIPPPPIQVDTEQFLSGAEK